MSFLRDAAPRSSTTIKRIHIIVFLLSKWGLAPINFPYLFGRCKSQRNSKKEQIFFFFFVKEDLTNQRAFLELSSLFDLASPQTLKKEKEERGYSAGRPQVNQPLQNILSPHCRPVISRKFEYVHEADIEFSRNTSNFFLFSFQHWIKEDSRGLGKSASCMYCIYSWTCSI